MRALPTVDMKRYIAYAASALTLAWSASAFGFADDDARKAILALQSQVKAMQQTEMDLKGQIDSLRSENIEMRGQFEQFQRRLADFERRLSDIEPQSVELDGRVVSVKPAERKDFDNAVQLFRQRDFDGCIEALDAFDAAWPKSNYAANVQYWKASAYYSKEDFKKTIETTSLITKRFKKSPKLPDTYILQANAQLAEGEVDAAKQSLNTLLKRFPKSKQAATAKKNLKAMEKLN